MASDKAELSERAVEAAKGLLWHSFKDIQGMFDGLTEAEREIVGSEETMQELVEWAADGR